MSCTHAPKLFLASLTLLLTCIGCGHITISSGLKPDPKLTYFEHYDGWLLGFAGEGRADLTGACPLDRIAEIQNYFSFEDVALAVLTGGIYVPHSSRIRCAAEVTRVEK